MKYPRAFLIAAGAFAIGASICAPQNPAAPRPEVLQLTGDTASVHDPAIMKEGDTYYLYLHRWRTRRAKLRAPVGMAT